eukprot:3642-Heterococcus_DN1.PRE.2
MQLAKLAVAAITAARQSIGCKPLLCYSWLTAAAAAIAAACHKSHLSAVWRATLFLNSMHCCMKYYCIQR